jgi:hypothetical protein
LYAVSANTPTPGTIYAEVIQHPHALAAPHQLVHDVGADEAGAARDRVERFNAKTPRRKDAEAQGRKGFLGISARLQPAPGALNQIQMGNEPIWWFTSRATF